MEKVRIAIKKPNKPLEIVMVEKGYRTEVVKKFLNNSYPQFVGLEGGERLLCMGVDEEGLCKELPTNFYLHTNNFPSEKIVGTVVFTRHEYVNIYIEEIYDYVVEDLTDSDIEHISEILSEKYQKTAERVYKASGSNFSFEFFKI